MGRFSRSQAISTPAQLTHGGAEWARPAARFRVISPLFPLSFSSLLHPSTFLLGCWLKPSLGFTLDLLRVLSYQPSRSPHPPFRPRTSPSYPLPLFVFVFFPPFSCIFAVRIGETANGQRSESDPKPDYLGIYSVVSRCTQLTAIWPRELPPLQRTDISPSLALTCCLPLLLLRGFVFLPLFRCAL